LLQLPLSTSHGVNGIGSISPPNVFNEVIAFKALVDSLGTPPTHPNTSQFMKKMDKISKVIIPCITMRRKALFFSFIELVG